MVTKKTNEELDVLREGGKVLASIMDKLCAAVEPGISTGELEDLACRLIKEAGARPAQKNFEMGGGKVFPTAIIVCINEEVVHAAALPSRIIREGDIVSIDFVIEYPVKNFRAKMDVNWPINPYSYEGGYYTDMSKTVCAGTPSKEAKKLIETTRKALDLAIAQVKPGNSLLDLAKAIQPFVEDQGFSVIRDLVGHGVGYSLHEDPIVPNYIFSGGIENVIFEPGMVFAIEPMVAMGAYRVRENPENFAYYTADKSLTAHFEHSVAVTEEGYRILTLR